MVMKLTIASTTEATVNTNNNTYLLLILYKI